MTHILTEDIVYPNKSIYMKRLEKIKVIRDDGDLLIVENESKDRVSVLKDQIKEL